MAFALGTRENNVTVVDLPREDANLTRPAETFLAVALDVDVRAAQHL